MILDVLSWAWLVVFAVAAIAGLVVGLREGSVWAVFVLYLVGVVGFGWATLAALDHLMARPW